MRHGTCIHYNGLGIADNKCCKAGVNYTDAFGKEPGVVCRMPCIQFYVKPTHGKGTYVKAGEPWVREEKDRQGQQEIPCPSFLLPTEEQIQEHRKETDAHMEKTFAALKVVGEWRVNPKPASDRAEVIECPVCKGRLHLSQSAYNGHVWGKCETTDCVSWME